MRSWRHKREQVVLKTSHGPFPVPVRFSRRRGLRHLKVSIDLYKEIVVNVPANIAEARAHRFLQEQADWIYRVLSRTPDAVSLTDYLAHRPVVSAHGRDWPVRLSLSDRHHCELDESAALVRLYHLPQADLNAEILRGLRAFALQVIPARAAELAQRAGVRYQRISVRDQRSRWGSCSERGTLSFNWRIVLLPSCLHDHLIWHELAHLTHLDHSARYWRLLASYDPTYAENDAAITEWSSLLMRLGRNPTRSLPALVASHA